MADEPEYSAPVGEIPASPLGPAEGDNPPAVDSDFIMSTLFGQDDSSKPDSKPDGDQGTGAKPEGGADTGTAPPTPAPAAKEPVVAPPVEQPPVPGAQSSQPATEQKPATAAPETPAPGTQPAAVEPAPAETRLTPEERLQLASTQALREQNEQLLAAIRGGQTQPTGQQQPQPSGVPVEQVHLTVPDELYNAIFAEDENLSKRGINVLVSSIATSAVNLALQKMAPLVDQRIAGYDQSSRQTSTAQAQEEDYYQNFQAHRNPVFRPVIESEMQKMSQEMPNAPWNADYRNALGTRVNRTLQLLGFNVGMVQAPKQDDPPTPAGFGAQKPNGGAPAAPAQMLDSSNRGAAPAEAGNFIAATFT